MHFCLGCSLSKSFFGNRYDRKTGNDDNDLLEESKNNDNERAFSTSKFSTSLFSILRKCSGQLILTLQSNELTIHRNIPDGRDLYEKNFFEGEMVLFLKN